MAEVIGFAASIVGLIQLAGRVISVGYGYMGGVKRASKDLQEFLDELISLSKVLIALGDYAEESPRMVALYDLSSSDGPINGCARELEGLLSSLELRDGWRGMVDSLAWPLKEKEMVQCLARIERYKGMFMLTLAADQASLSREIETSVQDVSIVVRNIQRNLEEESAAQKVRRQEEEYLQMAGKRISVLKWLYSEPFDKKHIEISNRRQEGTGGWLLDTAGFRGFMKELLGPRLLWGYGIPGAGKTFLSSFVINHIQAQAQRENYGVAYIYFDFKEQDQQTPVNVLASLVKQLSCQIHPRIPTEVEALCDKLSPQELRPTLQELYAVLLATSKSFRRVFLIFDALDECHQENQRKVLLPLFHRLEKDGINLFLTSRQYPEDIQDSFSGGAKIELSAHEQDITTFIEERINENPRAKRLVRQSKCRDRIISELIDYAKGMFLLVRFHIEYICQQTTAKQILKALDALKSFTSEERPLYPTYDRIMENLYRQPRHCTDLALNILSWLVKAKRQLTVDEIQQAVAVEPDMYELDELDLPDRATLLDVCVGLVTIDGNTIRLAHYTVQEYLLENSVISENVEFNIVMTCTTFLLLDVFSESEYTSQESFISRINSYPFLLYAVRHLASHLRGCDEKLSTDIVLKFLESSGNVNHYLRMRFCFRYNIAWEIMYRLSNRYPKGWHPLHFASDLGHCAVVRLLLAKGVDISVTNDDKETALHRAASEGHEAATKLLLEIGAPMLAPDNRGQIPIHLAADKGHEGVVRLLLSKGVPMSTPDHRGQMPIHLAAYKGHKDVVRLLLDKEALVSAPDNEGKMPIHLAADEGHGDIVRLLLEKGAPVSAPDNRGRVPIHLAAYWGREDVIRILISKGAPIYIPDNEGMAPIHRAAYGGCGSAVQLLLDNGASVTALDKEGQMPIHLAADGGYEDVVRLLLDKGTPVSAPDNDGQTPIHWAAYGGYEDIVRLLLDRGAPVSVLDIDGQAPIHWAVSGGHENVMRLLLSKGASISTPDNRGRMPIHLAAHEGYVDVVRLLLDKGSPISALDNDGQMPIHVAARKGFEDVIRLLLEKGALVSATDNKGRMPIHWAAYRGKKEVVQLLLEKAPADIFVVDYDAKTARDLAVEKHEEEVIQLLVSALNGRVNDSVIPSTVPHT